MKRVLIISYYWPPAGGGGVQRWLKFSKYLPELGWQPIIYTPSNGETAAYDESLVKEIRSDIEVVKTPIWEPYDIYKKFTGKGKQEKVYSGFITEGKKKSWTQRISVFIRGNFFIPDARLFWIKPSVQFLSNYLKENPVDVIISTGPPHSMHRIAYGIKKIFPNIKWIADFRDPWTHIDFYDQLHLTPIADYTHKKLEKQVLEKADKVVTVSWAWAADFKRISGREDIQVITNGHDPADFEQEVLSIDTTFSITHVGSMNADRSPKVLWKALSALILENEALKKALKIQLIGHVDYAIIESLQQENLISFLDKVDFMAHKEAIKKLRASQVLLLPINDTPNQAGVLPGKLYEYLGAQRPIICIGEQGTDSYKIMQETTGVAHTCGYTDVEKMKQILVELFSNYQAGKPIPKVASEKYSRRNLAKEYADLLELFHNS